MTYLKSVLFHSPDIVTKKTGNEYVLVPLTDNIADMNKLFTLNETGAVIWELIDGQRSVEEIIDEFTHEYDVDKETATRDIQSFIEKMSNYLIIKI